MIRGYQRTVRHDLCKGFGPYDVDSIQVILHCDIPYLSHSPNKLAHTRVPLALS